MLSTLRVNKDRSLLLCLAENHQRGYIKIVLWNGVLKRSSSLSSISSIQTYFFQKLKTHGLRNEENRKNVKGFYSTFVKIKVNPYKD